MGRKIAILAFALVAVFLFTYFTDRGVTNHPSANTGIVAFGDSLVEGVGSSGSGFVEILERDLGIEIENLGRSGDTSKQALNRVGQAADRKPALTIVLIGGNDFLRKIPEEETRSNISAIIEKIHQSGSAVILVGVQAPLLGRKHKKIFEDLQDAYNTAYVPDVLDGIYGNSALMADPIHPNDTGYRMMAERIKPVLQDLIREAQD